MYIISKNNYFKGFIIKIYNICIIIYYNKSFKEAKFFWFD